MSVRDASAMVAKQTGVKKNEVYARALGLVGEEGDLTCIEPTTLGFLILVGLSLELTLLRRRAARGLSLREKIKKRFARALWLLPKKSICRMLFIFMRLSRFRRQAIRLLVLQPIQGDDLSDGNALLAAEEILIRIPLKKARHAIFIGKKHLCMVGGMLLRNARGLARRYVYRFFFERRRHGIPALEDKNLRFIRMRPLLKKKPL